MFAEITRILKEEIILTCHSHLSKSDFHLYDLVAVNTRTSYNDKQYEKYND